MLPSQTKRSTLRSAMDGSSRAGRKYYGARAGRAYQNKFRKSRRSGLSNFCSEYGVCIMLGVVFLFFSLGAYILFALSPSKESTASDSNNVVMQQDAIVSQEMKQFGNNLAAFKNVKQKISKNDAASSGALAAMVPIPTVPQMSVPPQQNRLPANSKIPSLLDPFGSYQVTFRLYKSTNCDESDDRGFLTFTKGLQQGENGLEGGENCPSCQPLCGLKFGDGTEVTQNTIGSIKIVSGGGELDLYEDCNLRRYHATIYDFDQCVHLYSWPPTRGIKVVGQTVQYLQPQPKPYDRSQNDGPALQPHVIEERGEEPSFDDDCPSYLIVYSCESSDYFGYQTQSNYYGFLTSGQHPKGEFMRLMTSSKIDDMASYVPTFATKRHPYSRRYGPLNKADVIDKWYHSPHKPTQDVIVVIDPDNWIIRDVSKWVKRVSKGHALGEAAWFHGNRGVTQLWKEVCLQNCDWELDLVGVPYFVHKDDLEVIAPLFKKYILIMKDREEADPKFQKKYSHIQMGWGTEMFGYIFAAAHAGIKHEVVRGVQIRDVSGRPSNKEQEQIYSMIHMGRAWFPKSYEFGKQWWHTEGRAWSHFGAQVWCKCNWTASHIIPWPLPDGTDFQSRHTLYLLHESRQYFGEMPRNDMRQPGEHQYHTPFP